MKNMFIYAALLMAAALSCSRLPEAAEGLSSLSVDLGAKSDAGGAGRQLMLFNSDGRLVWGGGVDEGAVLKVRTGEDYTLVALDNCPDAYAGGVPALENVLALQVPLSEWNDADAGFASCAIVRGMTIEAGETDAQLNLRRLAGRVILHSVTLASGSDLDGSVLECAFLSNVLSYSTIDGSASIWANPMGRRTESPLVESHVIDGEAFAADCPAQTFWKSETVLHEGQTITPDRSFYCYPNSAPETVCGFIQPMTPRCTRLVLALRTADGVYYYPVNLPDLQANCSSEVSLTIRNLGSGDPDLPLDKAVLEASVTMSGWASGKEFNTNLSNQIKL